jgi:hypothetical protein
MLSLYYTEPLAGWLLGLSVQLWKGPCDDSKQRRGNGMKQTKSSKLLA